MNPPKVQEKQTTELPQWVQIPVQKQREMLQILSEMICRQMKKEKSDEPRQDT